MTGKPARRMRGFEPAFGLMRARVRAVGEARGFAVARIVTHWAEIVGPDLAKHCTPVKIGYGKDGMGATLTLLTTGAMAPILQMQLEDMKAKVNGVYGYNAISRLRLTQTAPTGFAEGQAQFTPAPKPKAVPPDPALKAQAQATAAGAKDDGLRAALEQLAQNILTKNAKNSANRKAKP